MNPADVSLPIDNVLPQLAEVLSKSDSAVLHAPTGAGKTTHVPPALWNAGLASGKQIVMLEPRRIAARAAARRIADEMGETLGDLVGYQVRFDSRSKTSTRLLTVTDGILLRRLQDDPFLEDAGIVIFDEFHERGLESDVCLAMVRRIQQTVRPDLKIVVMSATLAAEPVAEYLGSCHIVRSEGRQYPVEIEYLRRRDQRPSEQQISARLSEMLDKTPGHILVFLPGVGEILRTARELESLAGKHKLKLLQLYGDLPLDKQDEVLSPSEQRKVILATNVAESSLTIDGVTGVIDSGLARVMQFNHALGLDRLELTPISQASADQRAGRAGRTQPGHCLRLWEQAQHRHRPEFETAEIHRVDLSGIMLQLLVWGESDLESFPWYETPQDSAFEHAERLLRLLGAIDDNGPTPLGQAMSRLPVAPRLARLLMAGHETGLSENIATVAALLSERSPFRRDSAGSRPQHRGKSDVIELLEAFAEAERGRGDSSLFGSYNRGAGKNIRKVSDQLQRLTESRLGPAPESHRPEQEAVMKALLAAYPDRLAVRRQAGKPTGLMVGSRGVKLAPASVVQEADLFLCIDVDDKAANAMVRLASAVERNWLDESLLEQRDEVFFHPSQKQLMGRRRIYWDDLIIEESPIPVPASDVAVDTLFRAAVAEWGRVFPKDDRELNSFIARANFLQVYCPELNLPVLNQEILEQVVRDLCGTCRSFEELKKSDWLGCLQGRFDYRQLRQIDEFAPLKWQTPTGKQIRIEYDTGQPPVLAVRIQDMFGQRETPRIAGGKVALLLHLLAPNLRPQQVTDDLASFWQNTYAQVRKDLRRRYSKHAWPEDPLITVRAEDSVRKPPS